MWPGRCAPSFSSTCLFILLIWAFQWLRQHVPLRLARIVVFGPPAIASFLLVAGYGPALHLPPLRGIYLDAWHLFFLGTVAYWSLMGVISSIWVWIYMAVMVLFCHGNILGGVGCGLAIQTFARLGLLDSKKLGRVLPYIGSRSYSIYLVHVLVGSNLARLLLRANWIPETFLVLVGFFAISLAAAILAAEILYRLVEWPTHCLARKIAWEGPSAAADVTGPKPAVLSPSIPQFGLPKGGGLFTNRMAQRWPAIVAAIRAESGWLIPVSLFAAIWLLELYVVQSVTLSPGHTVGQTFRFFCTEDSLPDGRLLRGSVHLVARSRWSHFHGDRQLDAEFDLADVLQLLLPPAVAAARFSELPGRHGNECLRLGPAGRRDCVVFGDRPGHQADGAEVDARQRCRHSPAWLGFFGTFAVGYVGLFVLANHVDPLDKIAAESTLGRLGIIRGYLGPWIGEFYYLNDERLVQRALERREFKSDQLSAVEIPLADRAPVGDHPGRKPRL